MYPNAPRQESSIGIGTALLSTILFGAGLSLAFVFGLGPASPIRNAASATGISGSFNDIALLPILLVLLVLFVVAFFLNLGR